MTNEVRKTAPEDLHVADTAWWESRALATVEIILIVVVLISLVILFKGQLTSLVTSVLEKITTQGNSI